MAEPTDINPLVLVREGIPRTTSIEVARVFGKQHKNVLRAIDLMDCSPEFRRLNFEPTSAQISQPNGGTRAVAAFDMTKDGFTFLVMGFTGELAARFKEAYIAAFNAMEQQLRADAVPQMPPLPQPPRRAPNDDKLLDTCLREAGNGNRAALETLVRRFGYPAAIVEQQIADVYRLRGKKPKVNKASEEHQRLQELEAARAREEYESWSRGCEGRGPSD